MNLCCTEKEEEEYKNTEKQNGAVAIENHQKPRYARAVTEDKIYPPVKVSDGSSMNDFLTRIFKDPN